MPLLDLCNTNDFQHALNMLSHGELVVIKTDTLYALSCNASNRKSIDKIFSLKDRKPEKALPILIDSIKQGEAYAEFNPVAYKIAKTFWPGPLTLVLKSKNKLPKKIQSFGANIALRMPGDENLLQLINALGSPIIGTSANTSEQPNILSDEKIIAHFGTEMPIIFSSNLSSPVFGKPSTIIDATTDPVSILRHGAVTIKML